MKKTKKQMNTKKPKALKWMVIGAAAVLLISGIALLSRGSGTNAEPRELKEVTMQHAHGMSYTPDGNKIFFAVHDGLRVYEKGQWTLPAGEKHDYMGFSMVDNGFYSSGHPAPGSSKKNPFGIVKSTDEGKSFETLALYGQIDFHGMSVGYHSHAIYVFNPEPNAKMKTVGLHYSTDEARNWTKSETQGLEGEPTALAAHPTQEGVVAVGTEQGVFVSKNHGQQFEKIGESQPITALYFNPQGTLFAGGVHKQASFSRIELDSKEVEKLNIPVVTDDAISLISQNPQQVQELAIMTFNKDVYVTSDGTKSWTKIVDQGKATSAQN